MTKEDVEQACKEANEEGGLAGGTQGAQGLGSQEGLAATVDAILSGAQSVVKRVLELRGKRN